MSDKPKIIFNHQAPTVSEAVGMFSNFGERVYGLIGKIIKENDIEDMETKSKLFSKILENCEETGVDLTNPSQVFVLGVMVEQITSHVEGKLSKKDPKGMLRELNESYNKIKMMPNISDDELRAITKLKDRAEKIVREMEGDDDEKPDDQKVFVTEDNKVKVGSNKPKEELN